MKRPSKDDKRSVREEESARDGIEHKRPLNKGRSDWLDKGLPTGHAANWKERQTHREMQSQVMNDALNMKRHSCWESVQHTGETLMEL